MNDYYKKGRIQPLTCIIGAQCAEGAVMIADTRIIREYEAINESKFYPFWDGWVMSACAGTNATIDYFQEDLNNKIKQKSDPSNSIETIQMMERSICDIKSIYFARMGNEFDIDLLVCTLENFKEGEPILKRINHRGVSESVRKFFVIGHAEQYATMLFGLMFDPMLTIHETAKLGCFVLSAIMGLGYDQTIGTSDIGPEVVSIKPDEKPEFMNTANSEFRQVNAVGRSLKFRNGLVRHIWKNIPQAYANETIV